MFCFKCGAEIPDSSRFCMKCGTEIPSLSQDQGSKDFKVTSIPMNTVIKSALVSTIVITGTQISFKSGLKSEIINISDIIEMHYIAGNPSENGRLFITTNNKSYNVMFFFNNNSKIAELCSYFPSHKANISYIPQENSTIPANTLPVFNNNVKQEKPLSKHQRIKQNKKNGIACCPKCGSTSLDSGKQGFGIGKAVIGAGLIGNPIGLVAGNIHSKKVHVTCLNCGHKWKM